MLMDILIYINLFILGWFSCQFYIAYKIRKAIKKVAEDNGMSFEELANTLFETPGIKANLVKIPNYFTEINGNSILLYRKDTGDFVSQAYSIDELAENIYKFNNISYALVNHNDEQLMFIEGKVENNSNTV